MNETQVLTAAGTVTPYSEQCDEYCYYKNNEVRFCNVASCSMISNIVIRMFIIGGISIFLILGSPRNPPASSTKFRSKLCVSISNGDC